MAKPTAADMMVHIDEKLNEILDLLQVDDGTVTVPSEGSLPTEVINADRPIQKFMGIPNELMNTLDAYFMELISECDRIRREYQSNPNSTEKLDVNYWSDKSRKMHAEIQVQRRSC